MWIIANSLIEITGVSRELIEGIEGIAGISAVAYSLGSNII
ncbi:MAG TPA: hypothetical protein VFV86_05225 [Nitrososphaeraceae archaeon]|jgi:hypothetical protein|nr:hypothetical protein [Candidatus Nitrosocosmicus oleophilus]HEX5186273.1 hypothetical protein [Nitrososphaeraceae archaeon]